MEYLSPNLKSEIRTRILEKKEIKTCQSMGIINNLIFYLQENIR
jgi:hypothetical protein